MFDVIVIGGGVIGSSTIRELSRYKLRLALIEKWPDLSMGASKANSGIVHAGYDCKPNTFKARVNVLGNQLFEQLSEDLDFPFRRNGSMVLAFNDEEIKHLEKLLEQGIKNGVKEISIIDREEIKTLEPNIGDEVKYALYAKTGGIVSPYEATQAFAENAAANGAEFFMDEEVIDIKKTNFGYEIITSKNKYESKAVVNCAGIYSDKINNMVSDKKYEIKPRKGEYMLYDNSTMDYIKATLFQVPTDKGKGVLATPTTHRNLMIGPSSEYISDKEDKKTHRDTLEYVNKTARRSIKNVPSGALITSFTGLRANEINSDDFIVEEAVNGFVNAVGINSPGLSSAPAIALEIRDILAERFDLKEKEDFIKTRKAIKFIRDMTIEEQNKKIAENPLYGKIVCRCETTTEGEIVDAIRRPVGARTIDGVKRITRSGMGRCQGGFCSSRVLEILARELQCDVRDITKFGEESYILEGRG